MLWWLRSGQDAYSGHAVAQVSLNICKLYFKFLKDLISALI
jgi:hypothetical protein